MACSGSVFASDTVQRAFAGALRSPHRLLQPRLSPAAGAAVHAARRAGSPLPPQALARLAALEASDSTSSPRTQDEAVEAP